MVNNVKLPPHLVHELFRPHLEYLLQHPREINALFLHPALPLDPRNIKRVRTLYLEALSHELL